MNREFAMRTSLRWQEVSLPRCVLNSVTPRRIYLSTTTPLMLCSRMTVLCHLSGRPEVLVEMFRVLNPGGRMLFSDALVIGGMVSHVGFYVYSPPGENERLM